MAQIGLGFRSVPILKSLLSQFMKVACPPPSSSFGGVPFNLNNLSWSLVCMWPFFKKFVLRHFRAPRHQAHKGRGQSEGGPLSNVENLSYSQNLNFFTSFDFQSFTKSRSYREMDLGQIAGPDFFVSWAWMISPSSGPNRFLMGPRSVTNLLKTCSTVVHY